MKAYLRSARIAPKKANIIAKMVRGMPVSDALTALSRTNKKGARMVQELVKSAVANAEHNDKQNSSALVIKTIVVNQSLGYRRGVPMARGRTRPMTKFLSHIALTLGVAGDESSTKKTSKGATKAEKTTKSPSQNSASPVKTSGAKRKKESSTDSAISADSSAPSAS